MAGSTLIVKDHSLLNCSHFETIVDHIILELCKCKLGEKFSFGKGNNYLDFARVCVK